MSKTHIVMVNNPKRLRCACTLHHCSAAPQLGDPLCSVCRLNCCEVLDRRARTRRRCVFVAVAVAIFFVGWLLGKVYSIGAFGG